MRRKNFFSKIYLATHVKIFFQSFFQPPLARYTEFIIMLTLVYGKKKLYFYHGILRCTVSVRFATERI